MFGSVQELFSKLITDDSDDLGHFKPQKIRNNWHVLQKFSCAILLSFSKYLNSLLIIGAEWLYALFSLVGKIYWMKSCVLSISCSLKARISCIDLPLESNAIPKKSLKQIHHYS